MIRSAIVLEAEESTETQFPITAPEETVMENLIARNKDKIITKGKRVRKNTSPVKNLKIDVEILKNITYYSKKNEHEINQRIKKLDREWDIERVLGTNMSMIALSGIALSVIADRRWLVLPTAVLGFFVQHSLQGWCPPVTLFRSLKVRTRDEINHEKHALKALRGDYKEIRSAEEAFIAAK